MRNEMAGGKVVVVVMAVVEVVVKNQV